MLVLDQTPFYAESGGQAGDLGRLTTAGAVFEVSDTVKNADAFLHRGKLLQGELKLGESLKATVDAGVRSETRLNHSATHLMHAALKKVLGEHVNQRGSLVNAERLRFDFSHFEAVTAEELRTIESMVNEQIRLNSDITTELLGIEEAKAKGAMALFGEKYSETVRVLTMGEGFSMELCGGTHASRTGDIGLFRITSESGVASGVRRIEAVTGLGAEVQIRALDEQLLATAALLKADRSNLLDKAASLVQKTKQLEKEVASLNLKLSSGASQDIASTAVEVAGIKLIAHLMDGGDAKTLPDTLDRLKNKLQSGVVVLASVNDGKISLVAGVTKDLTGRIKAGPLVNHIAAQVGGKGGGRPDMARAGGSDVKALPEALASVAAYIEAL